MSIKTLKMQNHKWNKADDVLVTKVCKENRDKKDRQRILQVYLPDCSIEDISFHITCYQNQKDDDTIRYISEKGKLRGYRANEIQT